MQVSDFTADKPGELVRNLGGDWCFVPGLLPGKLLWTDELVSALSAADRAMGQLAGVGQRLPNPALLVRSFLRREAELSSRIEGTHAELKDLVLFDQTQSAEQRAPDVREVDNNFRALEWGLEQVRHRPLSLGLIREMHQILLHDVRGQDKTPGQFRSVQAHIGRTGDIAQATFVPAPPHAVGPAMEQLEQFIGSPSLLPPLARVAMIHYQFEAIHPFADGNGRIGRVLILLLLCSEKVLPVPLLNPSAFLERHRAEYYRQLLAVSQRGTWNEWVTFFAQGVAQEASDAMGRVQELDRLRGEYQRRVQTARASALLPKLVDQLFVNPAITTNRAAEVLNVKFNSAQKTIDKLLGAGIIKELTGQKRNRIYLATDILAAIEGKAPAALP
ncbi:MAG: Fic family protein [Planctomycetota bacterium]|nr:Fic family protein [Planctomycetota bacterium]